MKSEYLFPTMLIVLDVAAAMPYAFKANWRMMIYWLAHRLALIRSEAESLKTEIKNHNQKGMQ